MFSNLDSLIETLAKDNNLTKVEVERVIDSIFRTIRNEIESNEFNVINICKLGKFKPNVGGIKLKNKLNDSRIQCNN